MTVGSSNGRATATILTGAAWNYGRIEPIADFQIFAHVGHRLRKKITDSKIRDRDSTLPLYGFPFYKLAFGKINNE